MLSFTSYTKIGLRLATFVGAFIGLVSVIVAIVYLILKLIYWNRFAAGMATLIILVCFLGCYAAYIHRSYGRVYTQYE